MRTIEDLLNELCYWEDPDSALVVMPTQSGGVCVTSYDGEGYVEAPTFLEALEKKFARWKQKH